MNLNWSEIANIANTAIDGLSNDELVDFFTSGVETAERDYNKARELYKRITIILFIVCIIVIGIKVFFIK